MMYKLVGADNQEYGPASADQVRAWIREGRANAHTWVVRQGETQWLRLGGLPEFAAEFGGPASTPAFAPMPAGAPRTNTMAVLGFICGLLAFTIGQCCCYGLPFNVLGIIFSAIALGQISGDGQQQGRSLAIAGLALSILSFVLAGVFALLFGAMMHFPELPKGLNI
jgi:hypothetical protein